MLEILIAQLDLHKELRDGLLRDIDNWLLELLNGEGLVEEMVDGLFEVFGLSLWWEVLGVDVVFFAGGTLFENALGALKHTHEVFLLVLDFVDILLEDLDFGVPFFCELVDAHRGVVLVDLEDLGALLVKAEIVINRHNI